MPTQWDQPHHDGSELYVPDTPSSVAERTSVLLRVPRTSDVTSAWLDAATVCERSASKKLGRH